MSWPSIGTSGYAIEGYTTIKFGTDGLLAVSGTDGGSGGFSSSYIVESIRAEDERDVQYIEQGTGFKATRITLFQGRKYTITLVDDTGFPTLTAGGATAFITITDPLAKSAPTVGGKVIAQNGNYSRKVEGKREVTIEVLTLIEGSGSTPT